MTEQSQDDLGGHDSTAGFALGEAEKVRSLLDAARAENSRQVGNVLIRWANGWLCQGLTVSPLRNAAGATAGFVVIAEASTPERVHHAALQDRKSTRLNSSH